MMPIKIIHWRKSFKSIFWKIPGKDASYLQLKNENGPIIYDVLTLVKHPKYGSYYLNIEAQKGSVSYPLSNRIDIYLADGIWMQSYGKMETTYKELKPFVSIWLIMNGPSKFKNKIKIFSLRENKIDGNQSTEDFNSKMKAILVYIGKEIDEKNQLWLCSEHYSQWI